MTEALCGVVDGYLALQLLSAAHGSLFVVHGMHPTWLVAIGLQTNPRANRVTG